MGVDVGSQPLICQVLRQLYKGGVDTAIVIVGMQGDKIKEEIRKHGLTDLLTIEFVDMGKDYSQGYTRSLLEGQSRIPAGDSFLLCNADHIFEPSIVYDILNHTLDEAPHGCLLVDHDVDAQFIEGVPTTALMCNFASAVDARKIQRPVLIGA